MNVGKNVIQKKNFRNSFPKNWHQGKPSTQSKNFKILQKNEQKLANKNGYLSK